LHGYIDRYAELNLKKALARSPVVAILGPRQSGKSTLAKLLLKTVKSTYLDLQDRTDLNKLKEPELFFDQFRDRLICLDEIQRLPEFFSTLRSEIDRDRRPGRFLILGSASRDLIKQSNETLAGRIAYLDLTPFLRCEVLNIPWHKHLLRGGFPNSLLAQSDDDSFDWRTDFIRTFLERDIPSLGFNVPSPVMERLWRLLAHYHGQTANYHKIAGSAQLSVPTLKKYLSMLNQTYMLRELPPFESNMKKRLVKSPKIYLRDTGILHALLDIEKYEDLLAHPQNGASYEGFAIENIIAAMPRHRASFLRTSNGSEVDLIMERGKELEVFEFKLSKSPKPSRGFYEIIREIKPTKAWIVAPVDEPYPYKEGVMVTPLEQLPCIQSLKN
jgi:uncharacterized protein